jgi:cell division protein ZapE
MATIRARYADLVKQGALAQDAGQARAVESLARLESDLSGSRGGFRLFGRRPPAPRGLYLWGPPGRGKSMLMDLFFDAAPVEAKRRAHFHAFMAETHARIGQWREGDVTERKRVFGTAKGDDPIGPTAELIAAEARLLCFDELQVTDIADAMILGRLFQALFERGVTLVATSNRPPHDLYKDGINRQLFLPFIGMIQQRCEVVEIAGPRDFRLDRLRGQKAWFSPATAENSAAFDALWKDLTSVTRCIGVSLEVLGRRVEFPSACGGLLRASFDELCDRPLGPQDYLALAERFHTVFIERVPTLTPDRRNQARRLVTLIDALYEAETKLVVLADAEPEALYPAGEGAFEFERTVSRLQEMRSADWLERRGSH